MSFVVELWSTTAILFHSPLAAMDNDLHIDIHSLAVVQLMNK